MKTLAFAGALLCALALSACAELDRVAATLTSPQTTQAVASLRAGASALVCGLSSAAAVASRVEQAVDAGTAFIDTTGRAYVASSIVCASLGGVVTGTASVR